MTAFRLFLLIDRLTDRRRHKGKNITSLAEVLDVQLLFLENID